jgi:uncharacterized protein (TIGR02596 family)
MNSRAFSLVELLVVMAILAVLASLGMVAFQSTSQGNALARTGQDVADTIVMARQQAMARNRRVEIRFLKLPAPGGATAFRAVQAWSVRDDQGTLEPLTRVSLFPNGVMVAETAQLSPLLQSPPASQGRQTYGGQTRDYSAFTILANGALEGATSEEASFLTLINERHAAQSEPANFSAIAVNPITGETTLFRP